jgi:rubrerythrin
MGLGDILLRRRSRAIWADPARTRMTLESFARTEEDGGRDIATAARRVHDSELAGHLERHAKDELKHAELFRRRARARQPSADAALAEAEVTSDKAYDLTRGRPSSEVDAHGFFTLGLLDELGEVPYVAMLHVAERRAAGLFSLHAELTKHDPETNAIFEEILRDENYHVAWTGSMLERWEGEGRADEVKKALKEARTSRFMGAWKRAGARGGVVFGRVLMTVFYFTLMLPFGLVARMRGAPAATWQTRPAPSAVEGDPLGRAKSQA